VTGDIAAFRFNEPEMRRLLSSESGEVARELARRAMRIESRAKINASGRPGPNVRTGRLRSSITWRLGHDAVGVYADVGTNVPYGYYLETGLRNGARYPFLLPALEAEGIAV
jgi:hypothetical protein